MTFKPWQFPENPFDYVQLIGNPKGIGEIPQSKLGTKICIIGAGCSGLCAAYELMKIGLHPVVYESARYPDGTCRIGGRAYTYRFPGDPHAFAELGAMRIPPSNRTITYYMDQLGIDYSQPFPDPLVVPTTLYFEGQKHYIPVGGPLPPQIKQANEAWQAFVTPLKKKMYDVWSNPVLRRKQWDHYVKEFANKSFYEVLDEQGLSQKQIQLFGSLGIGTGGFDSLFRISFIEILRLVVCNWEVDQRLIKGGVGLIPEEFWTTTRHCVHWATINLKRLNKGQPRPAVKEIYSPEDPINPVTITDSEGNCEQYDAVIITCSHWALETGIKINRRTFDDAVWSALQNIHMMRSGKVFIRTKNAFWKNRPPESTITTTITDEAIRSVYLFDFDNTPSGVVCLSYTWEDASTKLNALSEEERLEKCIRILKDIYGKDYISDQLAESMSFFWEDAKGYNGAFKLNYPGQYEHQLTLFRQPITPPPASHNGVFIAGETTSWAGGWIEGAIHGGLEAAMAVVRRLGGKISPAAEA